MGGFDDHVAIMGDWMPPSPSPRTLFSSMLGDDVGSRSISNPTIDNKGGFSFPGPEEYTAPRNPDHKNGSEAMAADQAARFSGMSEPKMNSRGGLLERMAARAGFNAPRLNTEHIRPADISQNQDIQSPFLTIPPGLSPTTLLDSPVFVSNSLVQPSPTTGKFPFVSSGSIRSSSMMTEFTDKNKDNFFGNMNSSFFAFRTTPESGPSVFFNTSSRVNPTILPHQSFPGIEVSVQSENPSSLECPKATTLNEQTDFTKTSAEMETGVSSNPQLEQRTFNNIGGGMENSPSLDEQPDEDTDQRGNGDPNIGGTPADDDYNWRKYGQKQVKGSEYPRSYYKCTHPNCPVKKKVERSQEGHITEIIYKGAHSHPKPLPNRRSALGSSNAVSDMQLENNEQAGTGAGAGADCDPVWSNVQRGNGASDWRNDNPEVTSTAAATLGTEYCNGATTTLQAQNGNQFESGDAIDRSSTFSNDEEEDDRATHGSVSLGYDGEGDESESKRRKVESYPTDMSGATRAIREPRVVVQTTSEVDILDDGYRWRKYGQKVVKGNPNPRSYYKCTSAGCTVRKHVERASHDLKSVITTYEGKHNHDVPAARNSSHVNGVSGNLPTQTPASAAAAQTHVHRPEPSQLHHHHHHHHHHNNITQFERPSSLGSFAMPARPPLGPNHNFGFGMNQQGLQNLAFAGLGHNNNQGKMAVHPVHHHYLGQPQPQPESMNDMGLMLPKGEPKVEPLSDPGLDISNGASVYHQAMNRMPLGPHM